MAQVKIEYVEVPIQETIIEEHVNLTLNPAEARTLATILARVGGCPDNSPRKHADSIFQCLRKVNVNYEETEENSVMHGRGVHFYVYKL